MKLALPDPVSSHIQWSSTKRDTGTINASMDMSDTFPMRAMDRGDHKSIGRTTAKSYNVDTGLNNTQRNAYIVAYQTKPNQTNPMGVDLTNG
jgi:hypothetical protein